MIFLRLLYQLISHKAICFVKMVEFKKSFIFFIVGGAVFPLLVRAQATPQVAIDAASQATSSAKVATTATINKTSVIATKSTNTTKAVSISTSNEWKDLDKKTQQVLIPLKTVWKDLSSLQQRKWIAIASQAHKMSTTETKVLNQRMHDWALLSPSDREKARINFTKASQLSNDEKLKKWQAYQALTDAEKASLVKKAEKPKGLALQNASTASSSKAKVPSIKIHQSASPQHPAIASAKASHASQTSSSSASPKIQSGTLLHTKTSN
jgi:hypothetical protein